jgi:hypothetical protein
MGKENNTNQAYITKHVLKKPRDHNRPTKEWGLIDSKSGLFNQNIDFNSPSWFFRPAYTCAQYLVSIESSFNICLVGVVFLTHLKCDFFYSPPPHWYLALC